MGYLARVAPPLGPWGDLDPASDARPASPLSAGLSVLAMSSAVGGLDLGPTAAGLAVLAVTVAGLAAFLILRAGAAAPLRGPQRYRVTVHTLDGSTSRYSVVTGSGSKTAASIAFDHHTGVDEPEARGSEVREVQVEHLEPTALTATGAVDFHDGDLFDRSEF